MLGLVYTTLADMIEENYGLATWNRYVREAEIPNNGAFTYGALYPDTQMTRLIEVIEKDLNAPRSDILRNYGHYMFGAIKNTYIDLIAPYKSAKEFLLHVEGHIHQTVAQIHQHAAMPIFEYIDPGENQLIMLYRSDRKMCYVAEGMIKGVCDHYNTEVDITHPVCLLEGDDHCRLELTFSPRA